jgi:nucleoside-diphosphate-sugar epimerase
LEESLPELLEARELVPSALIAGVAGFIGQNLAKELLNRGYEVTGLDNKSTSADTKIETLLDYQNFSFVNASVTENLDGLIPGPIDLIFHLASPASPPKYQALGLETIHANTIGTENLARLAIEKSARLIFASTSEVYGDPLVTPQAETYWGNVNPIGPRSVYDESKRLGETIVFHFLRDSPLDAGVVRIFNTYGPGMDPWDGRVVSSFIRQALKDEPLTIYGNGKQTRSFCYVDDLVQGLVKMALSKEHGPINLGNPNESTVFELADNVARILNKPPQIVELDLPLDDPKQRCPDITLAKSLLGWEPAIDLSEGITRTAKWMEDFLSKS